MEILRIEKLSKNYGNNETEVKALRHISLSINKGEFVAIVGPSGSGKSTLMHLMAGVDNPTSGSVFVLNTDIFAIDESRRAIFRRRHIGLIYQSFNLVPSLNVKDNICLPLMLDGRNVDNNKIHEILETMKISDKIGNLPSQLSGGQQQRVAIARAIINDPAIVLADEPTGNLDRDTGQHVIELLKLSNKKYNQTVIIITHEENIALQADRIVSIEDGCIMKNEVLRQ